jgi:predicted nucleic acid-binding protein
MIILDTNVISEPLRATGDPAVLSWLDQQDVETLYLTAITVGELRFGIAALPSGKKRHRLEDEFEQHILSLFEGRVLPFDEAVTTAYAGIRAKARSTGKAIGVADAFIAAIAVHHGFTIATRDVSPFKFAGIPVINPWSQ